MINVVLLVRLTFIMGFVYRAILHNKNTIQEPLTGGSRKRTISQSTECGKNATWPVVFIYGGLQPAREAEGRWEKRSKSAAPLNYRRGEIAREREKAADLLRHSYKWHDIRRWYASRLSVESRHILVAVTCVVRRPSMEKWMSACVCLRFSSKCCPAQIEALRQANLLSK